VIGSSLTMHLLSLEHHGTTNSPQDYNPLWSLITPMKFKAHEHAMLAVSMVKAGRTSAGHEAFSPPAQSFKT
jgi:hypothetical protein